jgi:hypothetical protein
MEAGRDQSSEVPSGREAPELWAEIRPLLLRLAQRLQLLTCVSLSSLTPGSYPQNSNFSSPATFTVYEPGFSASCAGGTGTPTPALEIRTMVGPPAPVGLNCGFGLEITLPAVPWVQLALVHYAQPAVIEACEFGVSAPGSPQTMSPVQQVVQTFTFSGTAIDKVFVTPPNNETLLLDICLL